MIINLASGLYFIGVVDFVFLKLRIISYNVGDQVINSLKTMAQ